VAAALSRPLPGADCRVISGIHEVLLQSFFAFAAISWVTISVLLEIDLGISSPQ
jgi:hypothetical protein